MSKLNKLIRERDEFLENHPELLDMQIGIDEMMEGNSPLENCQKLGNMIAWYLRDINAECIILLEDLEKLK